MKQAEMMDNRVLLQKSLEAKSLQDLSPRTTYLYHNKLPIRAASSKHAYKRHSWLLPEGETVAEIYRQVQQKRRSRSISSGIRTPQVAYYIDACILLKNLFRISSKQFEESQKIETNKELQKSFGDLHSHLQDKEKKIDRLLEFYVHQQHMREGATNLISLLESTKAANKTTKKLSKQRVEECNAQRDKNIERLLTIEDELNNMSGTVKFRILGLVGFSRVIPGDVYEVVFKLGSQKWKTKCKIVAKGQTWIDPEFYFSANLSHDLNVKMAELGKLGKTSVIGSVACSIEEFLLPVPQVFLLPINTNGTIKLKLGVVWSALDGNGQKVLPDFKRHPAFAAVDFSSTPAVNLRGVFQNRFSLPFQHANINGDALSHSYPSPSSMTSTGVKSSSPKVHHSPNHRRDRVKVQEKHKSSNKQNQSSPSGYRGSPKNKSRVRRHSLHSIDQMAVPQVGIPNRSESVKHLSGIDGRPADNRIYNDVRSTTIPIKANLSEQRSSSWTAVNTKQNNAVLSHAINNKSPPAVRTLPAVKPKPRTRRVSSLGPIIEETMYDEKAATPRLIDFCQIIIDTLADRKYIKIQGLEEKLLELKVSLERLRTRQNKRPSLTDSIVSALGSFSFLGEDDDQSRTNNEEFQNRSVLILPRQWKQCHRAICHHLYLIYDLITAFQPPQGPLREKTNTFVQELVQQKICLSELLKLASTPDEILLPQVCKRFTGSGTLTNTWEVSTKADFPLHCSTEAMLETFTALYQHIELEDNNNRANIHDAKFKEDVCKQAVEALCETRLYITDSKVISLLQFVDFFKNKIKSNVVVDFLKRVKNEALALKSLRSTDDLVVNSIECYTEAGTYLAVPFLLYTWIVYRYCDPSSIQKLQQYWTIPLVPSCIHCVLLLIAGNKTSTKTAALNAIMKLHEGQWKKEIEQLLLSSLEENDFRVRIGACFTIGKCKMQSAAEKLIYIFQTDDVIVKDAAESALKDLGRVHIKK